MSFEETEWGKGEGGNVGHKSIICAIIQLQHLFKENRKEKLCPGFLSFQLPISPPSPTTPTNPISPTAAHYKSRTNLWPGSEDAIIKPACEGSHTFQTSYLIHLSDLIRLCDLLWRRARWRWERREVVLRKKYLNLPPPPPLLSFSRISTVV